MIKFLLVGILLTSKAWALEAVVTVLETPLFREKSYDSPVVQYLRKGDTLKVHPSLANSTQYDHLAPSEEALMAYEMEQVFLEDEFIPTLDRQGKTAYVLSEHIYIYFNDSREFTQTVIKKDPTDYRLEEPLPKTYPLISPTGYRGQLFLGFTQPSSESYPYPGSVKTKGYMSPVDVSFAMMKQVSYHRQDRFYFGGMLNFRTYKNSFTFFDKRISQERSVKLGIGPTIAYDAYKGERNRVSLQGSIMAYFINQLDVSQNSLEANETRGYRAISFSPRISVQYHRKQVIEGLDLVAGTNIEMETPQNFRAIDGGGQASWWRNLGNDEFSTRATFSLAIFAGIQAAY